MDKDIKVTKGIKPSTMDNNHMSLGINNGIFCEKFFNKAPMPVLLDDNNEADIKNSLIYDMSRRASSDKEILQSIIDLLLQLRASQSDQNVFVQNNTVVRQQILNQLKNELLNVRNNLSSGQVQKLEVISSNNFDEKTLNDILQSLLEDSKKKSKDSEALKRGSLYRDIEDNINVSSRIFRNYNKFINLQNKYKDVINTVSKGEIIERSIQEGHLINVIKPSASPESQDLSLEREHSLAQRNVKDVIVREQSDKEIVHPIENITRVFREKDFISKHVDAIKSKLVKFDVHRSLNNRDFNYLIQESIKDRYEKLVEDSENRVLSKRNIKELELVNRREIKETKEEKEDLISRVSDIESRTTLLNKRVNRTSERNREIIENIKSKDLLNSEIIDAYNKLISKTSKQEEVRRLTSKTDITTKNVKIYDKVLKENIELSNIDKIISYLNNRRFEKRSVVNNIDAEKVNRKQLKIQRSVTNKYNIKSTDISDEVSITRQINKVNLINQNVKNNINIEDVENRVEKLSRDIAETESKKKIHNKIFNRYETEERIKRTPQIYSEVQERHNKSILKIDEITKYDKVLDRQNIYKKELSINKVIEDRENLVKEIQEHINKNRKLIKHKNIIEKVKNIESKNELLTSVDINKIVSESREILSNIAKTHINKIKQKFTVSEEEISKTENIYKDVVNKIKENKILSKNIVNTEQFEEVINRKIEQRKDIVIKKPVSINYKEIETKVKQTSEEIINKSLDIVKSERIKRKLIDEDKILSIKGKKREVIKPPLVTKESIKNVSNAEEIVSKKIASFVTPKIREIDKYIVNEKKIYREIKETPRSYFDNINERIEERVLLNREHIESQENVNRDIERSAVIYKTPISLKQIEDRIKSGDKKLTKILPRGTHQRQTDKNGQPDNVVREIIREPQPKAKALQEKDVIKMIESYMRGLDIDTISDTVMERVEEEMLSQRRRNGII